MKTILIIAAILAAFIIAGVIVCLCAADINEFDEEDKDDEQHRQADSDPAHSDVKRYR